MKDFATNASGTSDSNPFCGDETTELSAKTLGNQPLVVADLLSDPDYEDMFFDTVHDLPMPGTSLFHTATGQGSKETNLGIFETTYVLSEFGEIPAHLVRVGDKLETRLNGPLRVRGIKEFKLEQALLDDVSDLRPVKIEKSSLGENLPSKDVFVSSTQLLSAAGKTDQAAGSLSSLRHALRTDQPYLSYFVFDLGAPVEIYASGLWLSSQT